MNVASATGAAQGRPDATSLREVHGGMIDVRGVPDPKADRRPLVLRVRLRPPTAGGRDLRKIARVLLADANLDEAPVSDGDPGTLAPWVTVPAELRQDKAA